MMKNTYIYQLRLIRTDFLETKTEAENQIIGEHFDYLKNACDNGQVILVGRTEDADYGIVVYYAEDEDAARQFAEHDPAVLNGIMTAEVKPFRLSLINKKINL